MESRGVFRSQLEGKALTLGLGPLVVYVVEDTAMGVPTCYRFQFRLLQDSGEERFWEKG